MHLVITFTNLGPYHLARLRALADRLGSAGGRLTAIETAGTERRYPWDEPRGIEPFERVTLFPGEALETLSASACARLIRRALDHDPPDALAIVGYVRPECLAALAWARRHRRPVILMSESQAIDRPRTWWKEAIKARRVRRCAAALVGGPRHRDYLKSLGMPADRIALGYNAVDNARFARLAAMARSDQGSRRGSPEKPYFLAVNRFVPEKNLPGLVHAFAAYRAAAGPTAWDLVLCGGGPGEHEVDEAIRASGLASAIHRPGFLQADELGPWYAHAGAFVHPSRIEPWGLVVNEAAASGLPLLVSDRAGCAETLVPDPDGTTGRRFDPDDLDELTAALAWVAGLSETERAAIGRRAAQVVADWGPERFAAGTCEALDLARAKPRRPIIQGASR